MIVGRLLSLALLLASSTALAQGPGRLEARLDPQTIAGLQPSLPDFLSQLEVGKIAARVQ